MVATPNSLTCKDDPPLKNHFIYALNVSRARLNFQLD